MGTRLHTPYVSAAQYHTDGENEQKLDQVQSGLKDTPCRTILIVSKLMTNKLTGAFSFGIFKMHSDHFVLQN
jgi:hypothetical protein